MTRKLMYKRGGVTHILFVPREPERAPEEEQLRWEALTLAVQAFQEAGIEPVSDPAEVAELAPEFCAKLGER